MPTASAGPTRRPEPEGRARRPGGPPGSREQGAGLLIAGEADGVGAARRCGRSGQNGSGACLEVIARRRRIGHRSPQRMATCDRCVAAFRACALLAQSFWREWREPARGRPRERGHMYSTLSRPHTPSRRVESTSVRSPAGGSGRGARLSAMLWAGIRARMTCANEMVVCRVQSHVWWHRVTSQRRCRPRSGPSSWAVL